MSWILSTKKENGIIYQFLRDLREAKKRETQRGDTRKL
jgi:hypothetical protein